MHSKRSCRAISLGPRPCCLWGVMQFYAKGSIPSTSLGGWRCAGPGAAHGGWRSLGRAVAEACPMGWYGHNEGPYLLFMVGDTLHPMQPLDHEKIPEDASSGERHTGRGVRTTQGSWSGVSTNWRGGCHCPKCRGAKTKTSSALQTTGVPGLEDANRGTGGCQHKEEATSRFRCACHRDRWRLATLVAGGHWRVPDGEALLVVSNLPGSRTCLGEQG